MSQVTLGALATGIADELVCLTAGEVGWCVHHDRGEGGQRLWAHTGAKPHRWTNLSGVDVLLGDVVSGRAILILEIEETACPPKKLLGNVCVLALSGYVTTEVDDQRYALTAETEVWVCFPANPRGHEQERDGRALDRLRAAWRGEFPLRVRLVTAGDPDSLSATVRHALQERVGH